MHKVIIYTKNNCPYCEHAKELLKNKQIAYTEIHVDENPSELEKMMALSGRRSVPQIFINDQAIGGFDDLAKLAQSGELDKLLV